MPTGESPHHPLDDLRLQDLAEAIPDAFLIVARDGRIVRANRLAGETFGYAPGELPGKPVDLLIPERFRARHQEQFRRYWSSPGRRRMGLDHSFFGRRRDGSEFPADISLTPLVAGEGAFVACTVRDVTAEKTAREFLSRSEELLRAILDTTSVAVYVKDAQGRYVHVNRHVETLFHLDRERFKGKTDHDLFPREIADALRANDLKVLQTRRSLEEEEVVIQGGGPRTLLSVKVPLCDAEGVPYAVCGISTDITKRKAAENELRQARSEAEAASQARSQFLANMSHEMRTPLTVVIGMTELVLVTKLTDYQREHLQAVKGAAVTLLSMINEFLDLSKLEAGKLELHAVSFGLRKFLAEALSPFVLSARQKQLEMTWAVASEVPDDLLGDDLRLRQVLNNLVGNAIKFTEAGRVRVEVGVEERRKGEALLRFAVEDTGIGVPAGKHAAIFEPFVQADGTFTRRYGGTGLGLTVASGLVEMMGGRLWLESEVGKGSTFRFTARFKLPDEPPEAPAGPS